MDTTRTRTILFSVICPGLRNRKVTLYKDTWIDHICEIHQEVKDCVGFIERVLSSKKDSTIEIYQKYRDPDAIAIYKKCPHLEPLYSYIAITVKFFNDRTAVMTSCYGKQDISSLDMEVYDGH